jgi:hypothetical protein
MTDDLIATLIAASSKGDMLQESSAYREQRLDARQADEAMRAIAETADATRFHVLLALRRDQPERYATLAADTRAAILCAALAHVRWLNDFGLLEPGGSANDVAGQALVDTDGAARAPLRPLLDDTRPAPLRGSEAAAMSSVYSYRRCDFAYRFLALILGDDPPFDAEPDARDERIAALKARV